MAAQTLYLKLVGLSLRSPSHVSKRRIEELNEDVSQLRRLLSCVVCSHLLMDPYTPKGRRCGHNVCRLCIRGKKRLVPQCPQCSDCSDFRTYEENRAMALQLLCYKTLCVHLLQSSLFVQLAGMPPFYEDTGQPRIQLLPRSSQEIIAEGAEYDDMGGTFLPQPELPFLSDLPSSLPAETPPTTAATTPDLPYEQSLPEQLCLSDIELEDAATAEDVQHFSQPRPMIPTGSRMLAQNVMEQPPPILLSSSSDQSMEIVESSTWTEQGLCLSSFPPLPSSTPNFNYMLSTTGPTGAVLVPAEVQMVQMQAANSIKPVPVNVSAPVPVPVPAPVLPIVTTVVAPPVVAVKRKHAEVAEEKPEENLIEEVEVHKPATRMNLRNKKMTALKADTQPSKKVALSPAEPKATARSKSPTKRKNKPLLCRCGTTSEPGNLTCRKRRCPCYCRGKACSDYCLCRGCQNPHKKEDEILSSDEMDVDEDEDEEEPEKPEPKQKQKPETPKQPATVTTTITTTTTKATMIATTNPINPANPELTQQQIQNPDGISLVAVSNFQESRFPLILVDNNEGGYQGFNLLTNRNEPLHPPTYGFVRVFLGGGSMPEYVYALPETADKFERERAGSREPILFIKQLPQTINSGSYLSIGSTDQMISGNANAVAGVRLAVPTDEDLHSALEEIISDTEV